MTISSLCYFSKQTPETKNQIDIIRKILKKNNWLRFLTRKHFKKRKPSVFYINIFYYYIIIIFFIRNLNFLKVVEINTRFFKVQRIFILFQIIIIFYHLQVYLLFKLVSVYINKHKLPCPVAFSTKNMEWTFIRKGFKGFSINFIVFTMILGVS